MKEAVKPMAISKKRQALREAAKNLFYTQGFAAVSVEAICSAAHTSRVTFYKYYSGKNALVQELFAELFAEKAIHALSIIAKTPAEYFH